MSEEISSSFFSLTGKTGRVSYFFQNSIIMLFGFQYIYGSYLAEAIVKMQHNPLLKDSFKLIQTMPGYGEILEDLNTPVKPDPSKLLIKIAFIVLLRIVDLKRIRDIVNRKLSLLETSLISIFFSLPFVDIFSTIMLVTLPPKKYSLENAGLKEAHAVDVLMAEKESLMRKNKEMFEAGKISRADFEKNRDKYNNSPKK